MADIYDIHKQLGVPIRTLKKLQKAGYLKASPGNPEMLKLKENLRAGRRLTAKQLLRLVKEPIGEELDPYASAIGRHLSALGDIEREAMDRQESVHIMGAALRQQPSIDALSAWIRRLIDASPAFAKGAGKPHGYLAVRMLYNVPAESVDEDARLVNSAMMRARASGLIDGYWTLSDGGIILYHRKKEFDI